MAIRIFKFFVYIPAIVFNSLWIWIKRKYSHKTHFFSTFLAFYWKKSSKICLILIFLPSAFWENHIQLCFKWNGNILWHPKQIQPDEAYSLLQNKLKCENKQKIGSRQKNHSRFSLFILHVWTVKTLYWREQFNIKWSTKNTPR